MVIITYRLRPILLLSKVAIVLEFLPKYNQEKRKTGDPATFEPKQLLT